jgi:glycosyltransferase involved in cell wall biosynthesis
MNKINIIQMNSVLFKGDAISNVIRTLNNINKEEGYNSKLVIDLFSEYADYKDTYVVASADYNKDPLFVHLIYLVLHFIQLHDKLKYLKEYMNAKKHYKPMIAKNLIETANIRIWHYGSFYQLFRYFHEGDILFFHGITYSYLSYSPDSLIYSKNMLKHILDMKPFIIVTSHFIKQSLIDLGFKPQSIHILPLFHNYNLPYISRHPTTPKLIAWGRYALNKGIPELVTMSNQSKTHLTVFGDNTQLKEFKDQYNEALIKNIKGYATLSGKIPDFETELSHSNIYISNSYHEGFGMPLIEAEAHSLPVLARSGTAMDELVKDGYNGYLFNDINEVPELVDKIMKNYKQMSYNAWKHSQNYTYERFKQNYLKILKEYKRGIK